MPLADDVNLDKIANTTHGCVGADLESLCKEAAMRVVRRILPEIQNDEEIPKEVMEKIVVTGEDFKNAQKEIQPSAIATSIRIIRTVMFLPSMCLRHCS